MDFLLREANLNDLLGIYSIELRSFRRPYSLYLLKDLLSSRFVKTFVATRGGTIVGYVSFLLKPKEWSHIISIAVDPTFRRKGCGSLLLERALEYSKNMGCKFVYLEVDVSNKAAIEMYKNFGFKIIRRIRGYYEDEDGYLMLKTLT
ncbi:MAG: ribosomal protein S18-alanine N-acetyltransferase [Candidatus Asgardarchaeia archaeon]